MSGTGGSLAPTKRQRAWAIRMARWILSDMADGENPSYRTMDARELDKLMHALAGTIDVLNTALTRACDMGESCAQDAAEYGSVNTEAWETLRDVGERVLMCTQCGERPAVCVGRYEGGSCTKDHDCEAKLELCSDAVDEPACDECCGHGNEDGHCHEVAHPVVVL